MAQTVLEVYEVRGTSVQYAGEVLAHKNTQNTKFLELNLLCIAADATRLLPSLLLSLCPCVRVSVCVGVCVCECW